MKKFRTTLIFMFIVGVIALLSSQSMAYPQFVEQAKRFGAKDCRFCHVKADGGDNHNARGKWLMKEKERRNADSVDPEWLVDYKPARGKK